MAGLRKFSCYRKVKRAYTRKSKFKKKSYVKAVPPSRVVMYNMGDPKKKFEYEVYLASKEKAQVRSNAIESARLVSNRRLEVNLGRKDYYFRIRLFPHHVLRENKMLVGAGADRMQTGMQKSFGKVIGVAAQLKKGQRIMSVYVNKDGLEIAKDALKIANTRLPVRFSIFVNKLKG